MKIECGVSMGIVGSKRVEVIEIPDDEIEGKTEEEIEEIKEQYYNAWLWDHINGWCNVVEE